MATTTNCPVVLIHGIFGYGIHRPLWNSWSPYWPEEALTKMNRNHLIVDVGALSSDHDRACEAFYQLFGGRVDYGEAHSLAAGHTRFGATYDAPLHPNWSAANPVHLVGHSFGATTALELYQLLCCDFFGVGSDYRWVVSLVSIAGPLTGSTVAHLFGLHDLQMVPYSLGHFIGAVLGVWFKLQTDWPVLSQVFDFRMPQWQCVNSFREILSSSGRINSSTDLAVFNILPRERMNRNARLIHMDKIFLVDGSVISIVIEDWKTVDELKDEIKKKKENDLKEVDADRLHLFLAKTKDGKRWLPDDDPAALGLYEGLISEDIKTLISGEQILATKTLKHWLFEKSKMPPPSTDQIHVLVVYPKGGDVERDRVDVPNGPHVDTSSCDDLLAFLESEMMNKEETISNPHILDPDGLQFRLVGRQDAIKTAADCFRTIIKASRGTGSDRTHRPIPVCSGILGLGKTRMLEEGVTILKELKLDPEHVAHVIVPYYNGSSPKPVERSMPIEASFSWRLLYRFFLDKNCEFPIANWFKSRLPCNGNKLLLSEAIKVIERKLRQRAHGQEPLYLFLGIDEYQRIEEVGASRRNPNTSILRELVDTISDFLCVQSSSLVVLPMFAGTDLGVIASGSIANSSYYVTQRLPMTLLTLGQVVTSVESNAEFARFLRDTQIHRHLFAFGGVPRWVVEYLLELKKCSQPDVSSEPGDVSLESINKCFEKVWTNYVASYARSIETRRLVRLAAFAVSNQQVMEDDQFDVGLKWSQLRDSALCLLNPSGTSGACDVQVPYALLRFIADTTCIRSRFRTAAEKSFAKALLDMKELVDSKLFDLEPCQSWEKFGACFYAVRINALLVLGCSTVTLGELLPGALMTDDTRRISVKLAPSRVFECAEEFGSSTPKVVSQKDHRSEKVDWTSSGSIIVNGVGGAGVDIFFALKDALSENLIVFVDQRKRHSGKFQPSSAKEYLRKLRKSRPAFLGKGTRLVGGVMNCVAPSNLQSYVVPRDCFLLTRDETERFHGTLAYHPACTPIVPMNSANKTALKSVLKGSEEHVDKAAEEILRKRMEPSGGFIDYEAMRSRFKVMKLDVEVDTEYAACTG